MKKNGLSFWVVLAIIIIPFGVIIGHSKSTNDYLTQVSKVKLVDFDKEGWSVDSADVEYINDGKVFLDLNYGILYKDDASSSNSLPGIGLALKRHNDHYIYDENDNLVKEKIIDTNVKSYSIKDISYKLFYYNDNFYTIAATEDATSDYGLVVEKTEEAEVAEEAEGSKAYSLVKYNTDFKYVSHIEITDNEYASVRVNNVDNSLYVIAIADDIVYSDLSNADNDKCVISKVDSEFKTATNVECNVENVKKYFPDYAFQLENALGDNEYDYRNDENVIISEKGDKIIYTKNNNEKVEIAADNGTFTNVKFFNDMIVAIEDTVENKNINFFYSRINLYNNDGKMIDQIMDIDSYKNLDVDEANNKFVVSNITLDTVIVSDFGRYWNNSYDSSIVKLGYMEYSYKEKEEPNPNTSDLVIIGFVILFGVCLYLYKKCKKAL